VSRTGEVVISPLIFLAMFVRRVARVTRQPFAWHNFRGQPGLLGVVLLSLPGVIGAFAGTPLFARKLETGTFRYAWTQGVGRMRWAVAALAVAAGLLWILRRRPASEGSVPGDPV